MDKYPSRNLARHIHIEWIDDMEKGERIARVTGECDEDCEKFLLRIGADRVERVPDQTKRNPA